jgi:hypothetical protein
LNRMPRPSFPLQTRHLFRCVFLLVPVEEGRRKARRGSLRTT